ncbi:MAG: DUF4258 domain-containing protein [Anaerolineae bacterium]|nr:DUF4258 domain-containing protein [Anaerolineae bacterium]
MFERSINRDDVRAVIESGEIIREYPDDTPFPSRLILGWRNERPLHVVAADNEVDDEIIIITAYEPDSAIWEPDFKKKKEQDS